MRSSNSANFTAATLNWLEGTELGTRQALGQYMTPRALREFLLEQLDIYPGARVLDPAVGTGEFLRHALSLQPSISVTGWDVDPGILEVARENVPDAELICRSGLDVYSGEPFDFVIGNPPYFEMKLNQNERERFREVINGRPNIYGLFFKVGLDALKLGGTLAYVVPPSMNAGAYFKNLRRYLTTENHVVSLKVFSDPSLFSDAQTSVQVIVVRKGQGNSNHVFEIKDAIQGSNAPIFCEDVDLFRRAFDGSASLVSLGYQAVTGSTVWNQHKERLTNAQDVGAIPLIYARNISSGRISLSEDPRRPQYILSPKSLSGPAIVVNRIIGSVGKGKINAAIVPSGYQFAAENHLNVIQPIPGVEQQISMEELYSAITSPTLLESARMLTGNTQLSASEWNHMIPIPQRIQI